MHQSAPLWSPLRHRPFRHLWTANIGFNLGSWMQTMGAAWLMVQLSASPHMTASSSGFLLGCLGAGAVAGETCLPSLKAKIGIHQYLCLASLLLGFMLIFIGLNTNRVVLWLAVLGAGWSWAFIASGLNGIVQGLFPVDYRARGISIYLMILYGGTTFGRWVWGYFSLYQGMKVSFFAASAIALLACGLIFKQAIYTKNPKA